MAAPPSADYPSAGLSRNADGGSDLRRTRMLPTSSAPLRSASTHSTSRSSSSFQLPSVGTSQVYDSDESNGLVPTNGSNASRHATSANVAQLLDAGEDVAFLVARGVA